MKYFDLMEEEELGLHSVNGVRAFSVHFCAWKYWHVVPHHHHLRPKRKRRTAESCVKNMVRNLLSLKVAICEVFMHVLKMTWFLGSLKVLY